MTADHQPPATTSPPEPPEPERDLIWLVLDGLRLRRGAPTLAEIQGEMAGLDPGVRSDLDHFTLDYFADIAAHAVVAGLLLGLRAPLTVRQGFADTFGSVCYDREVQRRAWASTMGGLHVDIGR